MCTILTESAKKNSSKKRYKCPYCDKHDTRDKLISHIDSEHGDMIPQNYTASRVLFNSINKKDHGTCVCGCGRETAWNEDIGRYERLSPDPKCKQRYIEMVNARKMDKYGSWNLAADPKFQEKMLAGRRISGTYKISGEPFTYTGQYERNMLEFLDKVMHYKARDIMCPGPIIPYEYKGETLYYISDMMIIPYNLIIEIKDGGDNPNNRPMEDYRAKQLAKEAQIKKDGEYNYVRVTNNQFDQLLAVLAELKMQYLDIDNAKNTEKVFRVNESVFNPIDSIPNKPVLVHYQNNITLEEGICVANDALLQNIFTDAGMVSGPEFLKECSYNLYEANKGIDKSILKSEGFNTYSIYEAFTGNTLYTFEQVALDPNLSKVTDVWKEINESADDAISYMLGGDYENMKKLDSLEEQLQEIQGGLN